MNFDRLKEHAQTLWRSPVARLGAGTLVLVLVGGYAWVSSHETPLRPSTPQPIIQGNQLRFPAKHPQLALLGTETAQEARKLELELPARLVWNEERTQRIYPAFAGRVLQMQADVGQTVKPGQVLATLSSPDFGAAQADAVKAKADAEVSQRARARMEALFDADVISRKDLELAQADHARAEAELARAQSRTRMYGSTQQVNQALGLSALVNGVVVERNMSAGLEVRPDQSGPALFVITDPSSLWIEIDAREADITAIRPGTEFALSLPNLPGQTFAAKIVTTGDFIDANSRTVKVRGVIDNRARLLKAEMLGTAHIDREVQAGVLVPASAVQLKGAEHWCYVEIEPGVFEARQVKVGHEGLKQVLITEGVKAGERVVKENSLLLAREFRIAQDEAKIKATQ
jgi:cobalt-zinc-cadmium efflux system membrane fusion protein